MSQVREVHHKWRLLTKQNERLKKKIATAADKAKVTVNEELHYDMIAIANENKSFLRIFHLTHFSESSGNNFRRLLARMLRICAGILL